MHGLTHRAVEKEADLPPGTASNDFRNREALLVAAAERIVELHLADTGRATDLAPGQPATLADLRTESLFTAATTLRNRYLAIFELQLEAVRRPVLAAALAGLSGAAALVTAGQHDRLGHPVPRERIPTLIALYEGALFTLVTGPDVDRGAVQALVRAILDGCGHVTVP
ncbi:TetR/AcrR family transcriptional regulator [Nonomuraea sp. NPDC049637]|uniref:TetR/AcrR family transcriptional regulator n=1 Tax=Nonomuraea sp. NPDC049637 TaxID=3154356 RepID=UPI0034443FE6